jgi:hypothetical protein
MSHRPLGFALLAAFAAVSAPHDARAQSVSLDVSAGRTVYEPVSVTGGTNNLVGSVTYNAQRDAWVYGSAAVPIGNQAPFWDAGGAGGRFTLSGARRVTLGSELGANGYMFRDAVAQQMGTGADVNAIPFVNLAKGLASIELRGGWRGQTLSFGGVTDKRGVFETGTRAIYDGPVRLQGDLRWVHATEGTYPFAGASITYASASPVSVWMRAGKWMSTALDNASWGFGTSIAVNDRSNIWASVQQESPDPLYWNAQRRSWAIGMTRRLTRASAPIVPTPAGAQPGGVLIRLASADAPPGDILIAGSFNNWKPQPMQREGRDWVIRLPLAPGVYQYTFRSASGEWFVPASTPGRRDDGMGGHEAVLVVS